MTIVRCGNKKSGCWRRAREYFTWSVALWSLIGSYASGQSGKSAQEPGSSTALPAVTSALPWEYAPYHIRVWLAAAGSAELDPAAIESLRREIVAKADAVVGPAWSLSAPEIPREVEIAVGYLPEQLTVADIRQLQPEALKDDKLIWVSVETTPREILIRVRELDCHTRTWSSIQRRVVRQLPALSWSILDAIVEVFSPLARIEEGQGATCIIRPRAAGLELTPESSAYIGVGDVLQPVLRQNDQHGEPVAGRTQVLPYTYLQVTSSEPANEVLLKCHVISGIRNPIQGRGTSRRERWALKVRPGFGTTELQVRTRALPNDPSVPLAGLEVYAQAPRLEPRRPPTEEGEGKGAGEGKGESESESGSGSQSKDREMPDLLGVTDWRGRLTIARGEPLLRVFYLKDGGRLLARLPIVAGVERELIAEIPDDGPRLQAEGYVMGIQGEITELVAQRQLIAVRMRKQLKEGKLDEAQKILDEFRGLKTTNDLLRLLDQQLSRQRPAANPVVRQRIDMLYAEARMMVGKYVDVELFNRLERELAEARRKTSVEAK